MSKRQPTEVDPVVPPPFTIAPTDRVATAGSCFAQHISRTLTQLGFAYLVTEKPPPTAPLEQGYGIFPARFGNVYTVRQLLQLFRRAYGVFDPQDTAWQRPDGRAVDPFRPNITSTGFAGRAELLADRIVHFAAVREMFESCDVFIFTLGLTEAWLSTRDGAVFPLHPDVVTCGAVANDYIFHNFSVAEVETDLLNFLDGLRLVNPAVRVILTVSPVPLVATFEDRHVLVSTAYSKSVLRVAAETASRARENVVYFPSYEIVTGPHGRGFFFDDDLREVRAEGVAQVMSIFARHYLSDQVVKAEIPAIVRPPAERAAAIARIWETEAVICDEELLDIGL